MTRTHLLGAASAVALACASSGALAQSVINGGGSTLAQFVYGNGAPNNTPTPNTFNLWNTQKPAPKATFGTYWEAGSGTGQLGFITNNLSCVIQKAQGATSVCTGAAGGANTQHYGASDAVLSSSQISSWATATYGQSVSGNLIQVPTFGTPVTIPVDDLNLNGGSNYSLTLTDNDLCGIFSGLITDFSQITDAGVTLNPGPISVIYRGDGSGTSFLLTNHLADSKVCTASNTAPGVKFVPTTTFASVFPGSVVPANFINAAGSSGIANAMSGLPYKDSSGNVHTLSPQAQQTSVGYLTPDLTLVASGTSNATLGDGSKSQLAVALISSGPVTSVAPTVANTELGLNNAVDGTNQVPPKNAAQGANPALWVPTVATVSKGYPIVGYTTWDLAQCYADTNIGTAVIKYLTNLYTKSSYVSVETNNGFVPLQKGGAKGSNLLVSIQGNLLANKKSWNDNVQNTSVCKSVGGSTYAGR